MEIEEAKKILIEAEKQRKEECSKEILEVLEKHNCTFNVDLKLNGNQIIPNIIIISK